jgi:hypothetical protein
MQWKCLHLGLALLALGGGASSAAPALANPKIAALCGGDPALAVMSSDLLRLRQEALAGADALSAARLAMPQSLRDDQIQVIIGVTDIDKAVLEAVRQAGLTLVSTHSVGGWNAVVARCDNPRQLDSIAHLPETRAIRSEPLCRTWSGSVADQADISIRADLARSTYSVSGAGVRVGVLSDTIHRIRGGTLSAPPEFLTGSADQTLGDLPTPIRVVDPGLAAGATDEGNAMAQIIHDLAPGADISFASATADYASFESNITALWTDPVAPADVLVDDVLWYSEPMYQNGFIAVAANAAVAAGVPYFSAAGNSADDAQERPFTDVNPGTDDTTIPPSGVDLHDFGAAAGFSSDTHLTLSIPANGVVTVALHWDEPYGGGLADGPGSQADLDLYLTSNTALPLVDTDSTPGSFGGADNVIVKGDNTQGSVGSPFGDAAEEMQWRNTTGSTQMVHVVVDHLRGRKTVTLHTFVSLSAGSIIDSAYLGDRTIYGHAAAENVMAVGAVFYAEIDAGGGFFPPNGVINSEAFTSLGGDLPFWFPDTGTPRYSTPMTHFKPEIAAPDGADNTFFGSEVGDGGGPNFFGTSAAAPHAAAVAALMLERAGDLAISLPPSDLYTALRNSAVDADAVGTDFLSGDGLIDALDAVTLVGNLVPTSVSHWALYN